MNGELHSLSSLFDAMADEFGIPDRNAGAGGQGGGAAAAKARWGQVKVPVAQDERMESPELSQAHWSAWEARFGAKAESARDEVFVATMLYFTKNGCSPYGKYSRDVIANGTSVPVGDLIAITGRGEGAIRQFMRGRLRDSVECGRSNPCFAQDDTIRGKAADQGLAPEQGWLMADWIYPSNPFLKPEEVDIAAQMRRTGIQRASANGRGDVARGATRDLLVAEEASSAVRGRKSSLAPESAYRSEASVSKGF